VENLGAAESFNIKQIGGLNLETEIKLLQKFPLCKKHCIKQKQLSRYLLVALLGDAQKSNAIHIYKK